LVQKEAASRTNEKKRGRRFVRCCAVMRSPVKKIVKMPVDKGVVAAGGGFGGSELSITLNGRKSDLIETNEWLNIFKWWTLKEGMRPADGKGLGANTEVTQGTERGDRCFFGRTDVEIKITMRGGIAKKTRRGGHSLPRRG